MTYKTNNFTQIQICVIPLSPDSVKFYSNESVHKELTDYFDEYLTQPVVLSKQSFSVNSSYFQNEIDVFSFWNM